MKRIKYQSLRNKVERVNKLTFLIEQVSESLGAQG